MAIKIWPYKQGSKSARNLSNELRNRLPRSNVRVLLDHQRSAWRAKPSDIIINWGNSSMDNDPRMATVRSFLNAPSAVAQASNKKTFFQGLPQAIWGSVIPFTTDRVVTQTWQEDGSKICARTKLTGHSGDGLEVIKCQEQLPNAPLYTKYIPKNGEWRVHFFKHGEEMVFFTQQKKRRQEVADEDVNWEVRNHDNGFIYAVNDIESIPPEAPVWAAMRRSAGDLDFGAFDILRGNSKAGGLRGHFLILEVNTACGLESPTLIDWYGQQFERRLA